MPRPPTTIVIAPSRLSLVAQGLPALGVVMAAAWQAPVWFAAMAALVMGVVMRRVAGRRPAGELRGMPRAGAAPTWAWRDHAATDWRDVELRCDYLGPWLIGLRLDGRRLWLWPDSGDAASLRSLRRMLVSLP